jgi:hypothetical protein
MNQSAADATAANRQPLAARVFGVRRLVQQESYAADIAQPLRRVLLQTKLQQSPHFRRNLLPVRFVPEHRRKNV